MFNAQRFQLITPDKCY